MARPRKPPAFLVDADVYRSAKLASLPSDTARLGFFYAVLAQAKVADPIPGQFASRAAFREVAGRFVRFEKAYIGAGILEVAPALCDRCRSRWKVPPKRGALVVHDWHEHQYDPRTLERQRLWDAAHRSLSDEVTDAQSDEVTDDVHDEVTDAQSDGITDAQSDDVSDALLARDPARSRAPDPARSRESNVERRTENESLLQREDRSSYVAPDRVDVKALLARGWKRVTPAQLEMLDEIADRHDRPSKGEAWGTWAASVVSAIAEGQDPLEVLKRQDAAWQAQRRAEVDAEEARLAAEKAERMAAPTKPLEEILGPRAATLRGPAL